MATDDESRETHLACLVSRYVDRLNAGERIEPEEILLSHPDLGRELLSQLEAFVGCGAGSGIRESLGTIGDYTLRRQIGRGGMGVVYEAWENSMDRRVALKVLPPGVAADERALHRFVREAKTAGQLSHPNIVSVYSMGVKEQTPYFAMELVEGETLAQVVARMRAAAIDAPMPFGLRSGQDHAIRVARAFADVADGLQHAHSRGVVHRDIKPSNLILDRSGEKAGSSPASPRLRILDFGLARLEGQESLSATGDVLGTPLYMSPEQARRKKVPIDDRTDVYSPWRDPLRSPDPRAALPGKGPGGHAVPDHPPRPPTSEAAQSEGPEGPRDDRAEVPR